MREENKHKNTSQFVCIQELFFQGEIMASNDQYTVTFDEQYNTTSQGQMMALED